jgi:Protein of unknown function (DUF3306)
MPTPAEDSSFLSRWSRRKAQVRQEESPGAVAAPPVAAVAATAVAEPAPQATLEAGVALPVAAPVATPAAAAPAAAPQPPAPTMADVAALTRDSDFSRFVGRSVQPDVKNAALSKLFADPHFNVMDGLDTYIDDYGKPDPLPEGMLRQMLQAHVLGLFDHEKETEDTSLATAPVTDPQPVPTPALAHAPASDPAASTEDAAEAPTEATAHENTDLQLQPDGGAGRPRAESGAG